MLQAYQASDAMIKRHALSPKERDKGESGQGRGVNRSRYVLSGEVGDDAVDEVLPHDDGSNGLPIGCVLPK